MTSRYRIAVDDDRQFMLSGWSASQKHTRDIPLVPDALYPRLWHEVVNYHLDRDDTVKVVAHGETLHGFICAEPNHVLYVYVAQPFRGRGIARGLCASVAINPRARFTYACRTHDSWELHLAGKIPFAKYEPFRVRFPKETPQ